MVESRSWRCVPEDHRLGIDGFDWPETLPLCKAGATRVSPRGELWVQRYMPAAHPGRVDVFDDKGILVGYTELPPASWMLGFCSACEPESKVYLARTDDVGLIWLERYQVMR